MPAVVANQCLDAVISTLRGITLDGVASDEIVARDAPSDWMDFRPRGISVIPLEEQELPGTNQSEDYGYPFLLVRASGTAKGWNEHGEITPRWRNTVRKAFNQRRLVGVSEVWICQVSSGDYLSQRPWEENKAISTMVVTCWARERRN